jgi:hypothetical protein
MTTRNVSWLHAVLHTMGISKWGKYYPHFIPHPHFSTEKFLVNFFFLITYPNAENKEQISCLVMKLQKIVSNQPFGW